MKEKFLKKHANKTLTQDIKRKTAHLVLFIVLICGAAGYEAIYYSIYGFRADIYPSFAWEYREGPFWFFRIVEDFNNYPRVSIFHLYFLCIFFMAGYLFIMFETVRHSKIFYLPLDRIAFFMFREEEFDSLATYFEFFLAVSVSAFVLPPLLGFAIVGISCIGDLMASQCGIRWGKRHIRFNPKKTWVGTIAGTVSSFLITSIFAGNLYGFLAALVFMIIDIVTEKPVPISDNLLLPICETTLFIILNLLGVQYQFPEWLPFIFTI
ncbi:MAG: hypothetical protein GF364_11665 [Candidatus Lokiarchaeota archaeon]|nr:hypothetical protein [Candidatus Lokiarchaeota archaeon]